MRVHFTTVQLEEIEFCEGILEIGENAFRGLTLKGIGVPSIVTVICMHLGRRKSIQ